MIPQQSNTQAEHQLQRQRQHTVEGTKVKLKYLASPYTAVGMEPNSSEAFELEESRFNDVRAIAEALTEEGQQVFSPILYSHPMHTRGIVPPQGWLNYSIEMLKRCDELVIVQLPGYDYSAGIKEETYVALEKGIPISSIEPLECSLMIKRYYIENNLFKDGRVSTASTDIDTPSTIEPESTE